MLPSSDDALAAAQAALLGALTGRAESPPGFGDAGVQAMGEVLLAKRRRAVVRACPALRSELGEPFGLLFAEYASVSRAPDSEDPAGDAGRFLAWIRERGLLTPELHRSALGLKIARGFPLGAAWISSKRCLLVASRLPGGSTRFFSVGATTGNRLKKLTAPTPPIEDQAWLE